MSVLKCYYFYGNPLLQDVLGRRKQILSPMNPLFTVLVFIENILKLCYLNILLACSKRKITLICLGANCVATIGDVTVIIQNGEYSLKKNNIKNFNPMFSLTLDLSERVCARVCECQSYDHQDVLKFVMFRGVGRGSLHARVVPPVRQDRRQIN